MAFNYVRQPQAPQQQSGPIQNQQQNPGGATSGFVPNYYNTFVQPMQPVQGGLQGTSPSENWTTPSAPGMGGYNGSGNGPQTPIDTQRAFQGLGTPDLKDHSQVMQLANNLRQQGHNVQPGGIDMYGRMDSLYIDGMLHKVFDSTGHWTMQASPGGYSDAWGGDSGGAPQQGNAGTAPTQQNDPNAWRRQWQQRQNQTPQYGGGGYYGNYGGGNYGWGAAQPQYAQTGATGQPYTGGMSYTTGQQPNYGASLSGTTPSMFANQNGQPTSHPMNQRLMY